jgi:hypothetical protein
MAPLPVRPCFVCGQFDDHPRDVVALPDGSTAFAHHDCHASLDPPCPSCSWLVQHKGDLVGDEWRGHVESLHAELSDEQLDLQPHERDVVESHRDGGRS